MEQVDGSAPPHNSIESPSVNNTPPFQLQLDSYLIFCGDQIVRLAIEAKIPRGFFFPSTLQWSNHRRNDFSVSMSFTLSWHPPTKPLFIARPGIGTNEIKGWRMSISANVAGKPHRPVEMARFYRRRGGHDEFPIEMVRMVPNYHHLSIDTEGEIENEKPAPDYDTDIPRSHTFDWVRFRKSSWPFNYALVVELFVGVEDDVGSGEMNWVKVSQREVAPLIVRGRGLLPCALELGPHSCRETGCPRNQPLVLWHREDGTGTSQVNATAIAV